MKSFRFTLAAAAVAGIALVGSPRDAHAALRLTSVQGGTVLVDLSDNGGPTGTDTNANFGIISLGNTTSPVTVGGLTVLGSTHYSNANYSLAGVTALGEPLDDFTFSRINSSSLSVANQNAPGSGVVSQTVTVEDSALASPDSPGGGNGNGTGFGPNVSSLYNILTSAGGEFVTNPGSVIGSSITVEYYANAANTQRSFDTAGALATPTGLLSSFTFTQTLAQQSLVIPSGNFLFNAGPDTQFGMALRFIINLTPGTVLNVRSETATATPVTGVPEPTTLISAVLGLGFMGGATWLRRRKSA